MQLVKKMIDYENPLIEQNGLSAEAQRRIFYGSVKGNEGYNLTKQEIERLEDCLDISKAPILTEEEFV